VVGPMLAGHTLLNYSLRYLPATVVSTATLIEPVGSTILATYSLGRVWVF